MTLVRGVEGYVTGDLTMRLDSGTNPNLALRALTRANASAYAMRVQRTRQMDRARQKSYENQQRPKLRLDDEDEGAKWGWLFGLLGLNPWKKTA